MPDEKLRVGVFGDQTRELHGLLAAQGFDIPSSEVERGFFGPATHAAVVAAQSARGLPATGVVDEATIAALNVPSAGASITSPGAGLALEPVAAGSAVDLTGRTSGAVPIPLPGGPDVGRTTAPTGGATNPSQASVSGTVITDQG